MYIYTYYSIKILDKKLPTLKEIPKSALNTSWAIRLVIYFLYVGYALKDWARWKNWPRLVV
jgi:hypothetical protein